METREERVTRQAEDAKEDVLGYLNKRYAGFGDTFMVRMYSGKQILQSYDEILVESKKYGGQTFYVRMDKNSIDDSYCTLYWQPDAIAYFSEILKPYIDRAIINVKINERRLPPVLNVSSTFDDYLSKGVPGLYINVYVPYKLEDVSGKFYEFMDALKKGIKGDLRYMSFKLCEVSPQKYEDCLKVNPWELVITKCATRSQAYRLDSDTTSSDSSSDQRELTIKVGDIIKW